MAGTGVQNTVECQVAHRDGTRIAWVLDLELNVARRITLELDSVEQIESTSGRSIPYEDHAIERYLLGIESRNREVSSRAENRCGPRGRVLDVPVRKCVTKQCYPAATGVFEVHVHEVGVGGAGVGERDRLRGRAVEYRHVRPRRREALGVAALGEVALQRDLPGREIARGAVERRIAGDDQRIEGVGHREDAAGLRREGARHRHRSSVQVQVGTGTRDREVAGEREISTQGGGPGEGEVGRHDGRQRRRAAEDRVGHPPGRARRVHQVAGDVHGSAGDGTDRGRGRPQHIGGAREAHARRIVERELL